MLLGAGGKGLVTDCWLLVTGYWLLVAGLEASAGDMASR